MKVTASGVYAMISRGGTGIFFLLLSVMALLPGCRTNYGPAIWGSNAPYLTKPPYMGRDSTSNYVSGSLHKGNSYNEGERNILGQVGVHRSKSSKGGNLTYGAFLYGGSYKVASSIDSVNGSKPFFGVNLRGSASLNSSFTQVDYRPIGISLEVNSEFGTYSDFVHSIDREGLPFDVFGDKMINPVFSAFTEFDARSKLDPRNSAGLQAKISWPLLWDSRGKAWGIFYTPVTFFNTFGNTTIWFQATAAYDPFAVKAFGLGLVHRLDAK